MFLLGVDLVQRVSIGATRRFLSLMKPFLPGKRCPVVLAASLGLTVLGTSVESGTPRTATEQTTSDVRSWEPDLPAQYLKMIDPELRDEALHQRHAAALSGPMSLAKLDSRRKRINAAVPQPLQSVEFERRLVTRSDGEPSVPVYVIHATPGRSRPVIVHIHGGGFTAGSAMADLPGLQKIAAELDIPIVTIDYRLAPETTWEGSLKDNYAALLWTMRHAAELGVDPTRIAVMGESAGGGHAALLALYAHTRGQVHIAFLSLIYPTLDDRTGSTSHPAPPMGYFGWGEDANRFAWRSLLGMAPGSDNVPSAAVPMRATDLSGLPPTYIAVGALDLLAPEDMSFAAKLMAAGVSTELVVVPGAFHGFDALVPKAKVSERFTCLKIDALRRGLGLVHDAAQR